MQAGLGRFNAIARPAISSTPRNRPFTFGYCHPTRSHASIVKSPRQNTGYVPSLSGRFPGSSRDLNQSTAPDVTSLRIRRNTSLKDGQEGGLIRKCALRVQVPRRHKGRNTSLKSGRQGVPIRKHYVTVDAPKIQFEPDLSLTTSGERRFQALRQHNLDLQLCVSTEQDSRPRKSDLKVHAPKILFVPDPSPTRARKLQARQEHDTDLQSDVSDELDSRLLVNLDDRQNDFELWLELLYHRARIHGEEGIRMIWKGMRSRDVLVPCAGPLAEQFWRLFLSPADLRNVAFEYAVKLKQSLGLVYEPLYELIMAQELLISSPTILWWHNQFKTHYVIPRLALNNLALIATSSTTSLNNYRKIYAAFDFNSGQVYDTMIAALLRRGMIAEALDWHVFLIQRGDVPSAAMSGSGFMEQIRSLTVEPPKPRLASASQRNLAVLPSRQEMISPVKDSVQLLTVKPPTDDTGILERRFSRELIYSILGKSHGIAPTHFKDEFCARLFATKAFSPSFVISGLNMFGVESIGPLALREMAIRLDTPGEIAAKINELQAAGISLGESVFSKAVKQLATSDRALLLQSLLASDQHPDVLEDYGLQRRLLHSYIFRQDWANVHRTLALLTLFHQDPAMETWNILLEEHSRSRDLPKLRQVLEDMNANDVPVTAQSLKRIYMSLLIRRQPGKTPDITDLYDPHYLSLVTNIFLQITDTGQMVPARNWHEIMKRYGMTGQFEQLSRLCLRLAYVYSRQRRSSRTSGLPGLSLSPWKRDPILEVTDLDPSVAMNLPTSHQDHPLQQIFSPSVLRAIVTWGFKSAFVNLRERNDRSYSEPVIQDFVGDGHAQISVISEPLVMKRPSPKETCLRGLALIDALAGYGVNIEDTLIRKVVRLQLWQLFGPGQSARKVNQAAQRRNPYVLEEILQEIPSVWREPLFVELLREPSQFQEWRRVQSRRRKELQRKSKDEQLRPAQHGGWDRHQLQATVSRKTLTSSAPSSPASQTRPLVGSPSERGIKFPALPFLSNPSQSDDSDSISVSETSPVPYTPLMAQPPRFPTLLDDLAELKVSKDDGNGGLAIDDEISKLRKKIAFAVFGKSPKVGGSRTMFDARIDEKDWDSSVDAWSKRPMDSSAKRFDGLKWPWKREPGVHFRDRPKYKRRVREREEALRRGLGL